MSRQHQRASVPSTSIGSQNHAGKASALPLPHSYRPGPPSPRATNCHLKCTGSIRGNPCPLEHDECFTDEAFTEHNYYDYYDLDDHGYQTSPNKFKSSRTDFSYSDDSDSVVMIPYCEYADANQGQGRHHAERSPARQPSIIEGRARIYPSEMDRLPDRVAADPRQALPGGGSPPRPVAAAAASFVRRSRGAGVRTFSRMSSRSLEEAPSAAIHGCGGKCQTFENVCYYFLQVAFTMGILIGISLAIAGWVLRKSAARNLQVLLYIGAMLSLVCGLLLRIQCSARKSARLKRRFLRAGKRANIPMDFLPARDSQHQPASLQANGEHGIAPRGVPVTLVQLPSGAGPVLQVQQDEQGIPWWRRKEMV